MESSPPTRKKSIEKSTTTRVLRLENPTLLQQEHHPVGKRYDSERTTFSRSKAQAQIDTGQQSLSRFRPGSGLAKGAQKQIESARQEIDIALGNSGTEQQRIQQRQDHKGSSYGSPFVSTTPHWTMGKESQDDYGLRRLNNNDGFGALVTIADVDKRRVQHNEFNQAEKELLVTGGIQKREVSYSFWAYPDESRQDGRKYTALLYDHVNDQMHFDREALRHFIALSKPQEL